ncbi:MAG: hypothetical protein ACR2J4_00725 [Deinococcus sp.]
MISLILSLIVALLGFASLFLDSSTTLSRLIGASITLLSIASAYVQYKNAMPFEKRLELTSWTHVITFDAVGDQTQDGAHEVLISRLEHKKGKRPSIKTLFTNGDVVSCGESIKSNGDVVISVGRPCEIILIIK